MPQEANVVVRVSSGGRGTVTVDGTELKCVQGISIECEGGEATRVVLRLVPAAVDVAAEGAELIARYDDAS